MSIPTKEQARRFLAPLKGRFTIILLRDARVKNDLSRFMLRCANLQSMHTTVLDTDAFYSANIQEILGQDEAPPGEVLLLTEDDFVVSSLLPLLTPKGELLILDDLNSLYSLVSRDRQSQQLTFIIRILSLIARMNASWLIATAYKTDFGAQAGSTPQSLTAQGDLLVDADLVAGSVRLKAAFYGDWPSGGFSF